MAEDEDIPEDDEAPAGGEDSEDGEGDDEGGGGFDAKKIILFVVVPLVILAAVGGGLYFTGMLDSLMGGGSGEEHAEEGGGDVHGETKGDSHAGGGTFLEIPPMIVNLSSEDGTPRYLRLSVQLELESQEDLHAVEGVMPRVIDQFQTYLRELRVKDLRGSAGIYRLQMELLWRVNQAAAPVEVKDVLFQEILIQ